MVRKRSPKKSSTESDWRFISDAQNARICELEKMNDVLNECNKIAEESMKASNLKHKYVKDFFEEMLKHLKVQHVVRVVVISREDKNARVNSLIMSASRDDIDCRVMRQNILKILTSSNDESEKRRKMMKDLFAGGETLKEDHMCIFTDESGHHTRVDLNNDTEGYFHSMDIKNYSTCTLI